MSQFSFHDLEDDFPFIDKIKNNDNILLVTEFKGQLVFFAYMKEKFFISKFSQFM